MSERAVSDTLSYSLTLAISAVLVVGLLTAGGTFVSDQRSHVISAELDVIGQRLAADVSTADRMVQVSEGPTDIRVTSRLPQTISGSTYNVNVRASGGDASLELTTPALERSIELPISNKTALETGTTTGGDLDIVYDDSTDTLEVTNA